MSEVEGTGEQNRKDMAIPDDEIVAFWEATIRGDMSCIDDLISKYDEYVERRVVLPTASDGSSDKCDAYIWSPQVYFVSAMDDFKRYQKYGNPDKHVTKSGFFKELIPPSRNQHVVRSNLVEFRWLVINRCVSFFLSPYFIS